MTVYLEQLASWNEFSVGMLCILHLLRAGMQGIILHGSEFLLAACLDTPAPHSRKKPSQLDTLHGCFLCTLRACTHCAEWYCGVVSQLGFSENLQKQQTVELQTSPLANSAFSGSRNCAVLASTVQTHQKYQEHPLNSEQ